MALHSTKGRCLQPATRKPVLIDADKPDKQAHKHRPAPEKSMK
ncbi:hypothetical protein [Thiosulfatimonas sediminis]|nr:hypothetical protein [Thiosulfatimonas sediminis]